MEQIVFQGAPLKESMWLKGLGSPGGSAVEHLPLAQGMTRD